MCASIICTIIIVYHWAIMKHVQWAGKLLLSLPALTIINIRTCQRRKWCQIRELLWNAIHSWLPWDCLTKLNRQTYWGHNKACLCCQKKKISILFTYPNLLILAETNNLEAIRSGRLVKPQEFDSNVTCVIPVLFGSVSKMVASAASSNNRHNRWS